MQAGQEAVVLTEAAGERLGEVRDLRTHAPFSEVGQRSRIAYPGDQRVEHQTTRYATEVARDRGQLDARVLEELLEALDLSCPLARDRGARAGEVAQLTDRLGRHNDPRTRP